MKRRNLLLLLLGVGLVAGVTAYWLAYASIAGATASTGTLTFDGLSVDGTGTGTILSCPGLFPVDTTDPDTEGVPCGYIIIKNPTDGSLKYRGTTVFTSSSSDVLKGTELVNQYMALKLERAPIEYTAAPPSGYTFSGVSGTVNDGWMLKTEMDSDTAPWQDVIPPHTAIVYRVNGALDGATPSSYQGIPYVFSLSLTATSDGNPGWTG